MHKQFKVKPILASTLLALALTGCAVTPTPLTKEAVTKRVSEDIKQAYKGQQKISGEISLEEATARALKYNLDFRLKKMESALALGTLENSNFDMWPQIIAQAGYNERSNLSGGTSVGIDDGIQSLRPSTSQQRQFLQQSAELSWNVLDFGVSYYRAKQNADNYLIAEERKRKLTQHMIQDVRAAYWRALGAQELDDEAQATLKRAKAALAKSREAEAQKLISPNLALNYQSALLDSIMTLNTRRKDLSFAKHELAALMNVSPDEEFRLAGHSKKTLPPIPTDIVALEEMALMQRAELREEDYKKRISAAEAKKQILSLLPNLNLAASLQNTTNKYTTNKDWTQASVGITLNLMKLVSLPSKQRALKQQVSVDEARRLALSMAIYTQVRVSAERYALAVENYNSANEIADVDDRLAYYTKASKTAKLASDLEVVRTQTRAILGAYKRSAAFADAEIAYGRLYNSLGFDAVHANFEGDSLAALIQKMKAHFDESENQALTMKSDLFGDHSIHDSHVFVSVTGVGNSAETEAARSELLKMLVRNGIPYNADGFPLSFHLERSSKLGVEEMKWHIQLRNKEQQLMKHATFKTKVPVHSRHSLVGTSLNAAATSKVQEIKTWLVDAVLNQNATITETDIGKTNQSNKVCDWRSGKACHEAKQSAQDGLMGDSIGDVNAAAEKAATKVKVSTK